MLNLMLSSCAWILNVRFARLCRCTLNNEHCVNAVCNCACAINMCDVNGEQKRTRTIATAPNVHVRRMRAFCESFHPIWPVAIPRHWACNNVNGVCMHASFRCTFSLLSPFSAHSQSSDHYKHRLFDTISAACVMLMHTISSETRSEHLYSRRRFGIFFCAHTFELGKQDKILLIGNKMNTISGLLAVCWRQCIQIKSNHID